MKVRIAYTTTVDDTYRRAIRFRQGKEGLASRAEIQQWIRVHGMTLDDEIMQDWADEEQRREDEAA